MKFDGHHHRGRNGGDERMGGSAGERRKHANVGLGGGLREQSGGVAHHEQPARTSGTDLRRGRAAPPGADIADLRVTACRHVGLGGGRRGHSEGAALPTHHEQLAWTSNATAHLLLTSISRAAMAAAMADLWVTASREAHLQLQCHPFPSSQA